MTKHEFSRSLDVKYLDSRKLKISMIGNMAVGKSCLALRFVQNKFMDRHKPTIIGMLYMRCLNGPGFVLFVFLIILGTEAYFGVCCF